MNFIAIKKLYVMFEKPFRKKALGLQFLLLIGVFFEGVGLGLLIPLVSVIMDINNAKQNKFIHFVRGIVGDISDQQFIYLILGIFLVFYCIKTIFLSFLTWQQTEFTQSLSLNLSSRLYRGYLFQPYIYFLDKNSAILMRNILSEVNSATSYVAGIMSLQTEISVIIGVLTTLFFLEPFGAIIVFCFIGTVSYVLFSFSKKKLSNWGKERQEYDGIRSKNVMQGLSGLVELKLFNKENFFLQKFDSATKISTNAIRKSQFIQQVGRYFIELVLIISVVLLSVAVVYQGKTFSAILPSMSMFLFASLRLLPSSNRIIASLQVMRVAKPTLDLISEELIKCNQENEPRNSLPKKITSLKKLVSFKNIGYVYPKAIVPALVDISLDIKIGSVIGIIGQSGSGKTTLINILTGLLKPASGMVIVDGVDITDSLFELRKFIGYVPQNIFLIDDTLKRNIAFGIADSEINDDHLSNVIRIAQLDNVVDNLSEGVNTNIGERGVKLSGGQKQRIGIARALYNNPSILILDEGTSALDIETEKYIMSAVANLKGKITIILVAHRYSTLHFCDLVYKMEKGLIVGKGKLEELITE